MMCWNCYIKASKNHTRMLPILNEKFGIKLQLNITECYKCKIISVQSNAINLLVYIVPNYLRNYHSSLTFKNSNHAFKLSMLTNLRTK